MLFLKVHGSFSPRSCKKKMWSTLNHVRYQIEMLNMYDVQKINNTKLSIHVMTLQRIEQSLKYSTSKSIVVEVWNTSTLDWRPTFYFGLKIWSSYFRAWCYLDHTLTMVPMHAENWGMKRLIVWFNQRLKCIVIRQT